jgi:threonine dehydratase
MEQSIKEGAIKHLDSVSTIADGIAVKEPGVNTFEMCQKFVDDIVTVTDDEVAAAILALIEQHKLVAEGAGAVSVAAAMFNKLPVKGKKVVCLVSGGNIDVNTLSRVITRGLVKSGRNYTLILDLYDKPGQLSGVCNVIAEQGGNVLSVTHERNNDAAGITGCQLRIDLETLNNAHINAIRQALIDAGYNVVN